MYRVPLVAGAMLAFVAFVALRYAVPEGAFSGLTDDHFYFVTQGWQMLFGEWPDRDYFEPGAPLTLGISAALQVLLGRSTWSEYVFCVVALGLGSAVTFVLAARASGSMLLGALAWLFQLALLPRLYGYPKIVAYALAIAASWAWASAPTVKRVWVVAGVTALAFLLRHDHGVYIGVGFGVLIVALRDLPWLDRVKQAVVYGVAVLVLLTPYFVYLQVNGGIRRHFETTYAWSARDFGRSPRVLPAFEWRPLFETVDTDADAAEWWEHAPWVQLSDQSTFWLFWLFTLLPVIALVLLIATPATGPPLWVEERAKVLSLIAVAVALHYGFLRGNLAGRLADVSVPMVVLAAWIMARVWAVVRRRGRVRGGAMARVALAAVTVVTVCGTALVLVRPFRTLIEASRAAEGIPGLRFQAGMVTERLQNTWPLDAWASRERSDFILARYLQACTGPSDRVLVTEFRAQILGLAQRGFAAGHVDMRGGGFFATAEEQRVTIARWRGQSVPVVLGPTQEDYADWVADQPLVAEHLTGEYENLGEQNVDGYRFILFGKRNARVVRQYAPLGFPCYR